MQSVVSLLMLVAVMLVLFARAAPRVNVPGQPTDSRWVLQDFRDALYYPVVSFLRGENPFDTEAYRLRYPVLQPFPPYSPLTLLVHAPFGLLPHRASQLAFCGFSLLLVIVLAAISLKMCGRKPTVSSTCVLAAAILASRPGWSNQLLGQTALELVLATYASLYFARARPRTAGLGLVVASLKPTFGVPLVLLLGVQRCSRALAWGLATTTVLTAIPVALLVRAAGGPRQLLATVLGAYSTLESEAVSSAVLSPARVDAVAVAGHLLHRELGAAGVAAVFVAVMVVAAAALRHVRRRAQGRSADLYCISLASVAVLVSVYHQVYSCLLLVLPLTALVVGHWAPSEMRCPAWSRWVLVGLLAVPAVNYGASQSVADHLEVGSLLWTVTGAANGVALIGAFLLLAGMPLLAAWDASDSG